MVSTRSHDEAELVPSRKRSKEHNRKQEQEEEQHARKKVSGDAGVARGPQAKVVDLGDQASVDEENQGPNPDGAVKARQHAAGAHASKRKAKKPVHGKPRTEGRELGAADGGMQQPGTAAAAREAAAGLEGSTGQAAADTKVEEGAYEAAANPWEVNPFAGLDGMPSMRWDDKLEQADQVSMAQAGHVGQLGLKFVGVPEDYRSEMPDLVEMMKEEQCELTVSFSSPVAMIRRVAARLFERVFLPDMMMLVHMDTGRVLQDVDQEGQPTSLASYGLQSGNSIYLIIVKHKPSSYPEAARLEPPEPVAHDAAPHAASAAPAAAAVPAAAASKPSKGELQLQAAPKPTSATNKPSDVQQQQSVTGPTDAGAALTKPSKGQLQQQQQAETGPSAAAGTSKSSKGQVQEHQQSAAAPSGAAAATAAASKPNKGQLLHEQQQPAAVPSAPAPASKPSKGQLQQVQEQAAAGPSAAAADAAAPSAQQQKAQPARKLPASLPGQGKVKVEAVALPAAPPAAAAAPAARHQQQQQQQIKVEPGPAAAAPAAQPPLHVLVQQVKAEVPAGAAAAGGVPAVAGVAAATTADTSRFDSLLDAVAVAQAVAGDTQPPATAAAGSRGAAAAPVVSSGSQQQQKQAGLAPRTAASSGSVQQQQAAGPSSGAGPSIFSGSQQQHGQQQQAAGARGPASPLLGGMHINLRDDSARDPHAASAILAGKKRRFWGPAETEALLEGISIHGRSWKLIQDSYGYLIPGRNHKDFKDRWENLEKAYYKGWRDERVKLPERVKLMVRALKEEGQKWPAPEQPAAAQEEQREDAMQEEQEERGMQEEPRDNTMQEEQRDNIAQDEQRDSTMQEEQAAEVADP